MQSQGSDEEQAAIVLGASGWQTFWHVTLPNIKWGLLYGVILCNARAMGEFGAVSVVSGHLRGETNTIPLQVEILYNQFQIQAGFAVASLLALLALLTLVIKSVAKWRHEHELKRLAELPMERPADDVPEVASRRQAALIPSDAQTRSERSEQQHPSQSTPQNARNEGRA